MDGIFDTNSPSEERQALLREEHVQDDRVEEQNNSGMCEADPSEPRHMSPGNSALRVVKTVLGCSYSNLLLPFVFLGITAGNQGWDDSIGFVFNFLAILPLAALLSFATEELAKSVGQTLGGLINATFGNAVEMIVSVSEHLDLIGETNILVIAQVGITAVRQGEINIVQSSMVGSILSGNLLVSLNIPVSWVVC
jgi:Ca2+:H+ antiporter